MHRLLKIVCVVILHIVPNHKHCLIDFPKPPPLQAMYPPNLPYDQAVFFDDEEQVNLLTDTSLHELKHIG